MLWIQRADQEGNHSASAKGNLIKCVKWVYSETLLLGMWDYHILFTSHKFQCLLEASHFCSFYREYIAKKYLQSHFTLCSDGFE